MSVPIKWETVCKYAWVLSLWCFYFPYMPALARWNQFPPFLEGNRHSTWNMLCFTVLHPNCAMCQKNRLFPNWYHKGRQPSEGWLFRCQLEANEELDSNSVILKTSCTHKLLFIYTRPSKEDVIEKTAIHLLSTKSMASHHWLKTSQYYW